MANRFLGTDSADPGLPDSVAATNDEAFDATSDKKGLTPANWAFIRSAIAPKVKSTNTGAQNNTAINAALDEAIGTSNPVTTTRTANRAIEFRSGSYKLATPINIRSVIGLEMVGKGFVNFVADTNMASVFDINGMGYSTIGGFTVTGTGGVQVTDTIYTYWDTAGALFPSTKNTYHDIVVRNLDYVTAFRVGKSGSNLATDNDSFHNLILDGAWTTGNTTRYQNGLLLGTTVAANNLVHHVYKLTAGAHRYPLRVDNTQVALYGAGFDTAETAIWCQSSGYASFRDIDCETCERLFLSPGSGANVNVSISNVLFRADALNADGKWIDHSMGGTLNLENLSITGATVTPLIDTGGAMRVNVNGLSVQATGNPTVSQCVVVAGASSVKVRGFVSVDETTGLAGAHTDWDSATVVSMSGHGATGVRPTAAAAGIGGRWFDDTLGTPVFSDGTNWRQIGVKTDVYTSGTTTWTKPAWAQRVTLAAVAGGSGGGSGRRGAAATVRCGGGGGGGGVWAYADYAAADLPATMSVQAGAAGAGGAAVTANDTNGNVGIAGTSSYVYVGSTFYLVAEAGGPGAGGTAASGTGGTAGVGQFPGAVGATASTTGLDGVYGPYGADGGAGGGSGGGITAADVASAGGGGGTTSYRIGVQGAAGGAIGAAGGTPAVVSGASTAVPGHGGGGGGSSITAAAGAGGAGAVAGAGGGGGGASLNGNNSGAGGAGGAGRVVITSFG